MEQEINKIIDAMKVVLKSNLFKEDVDGNMVREIGRASCRERV